MEKKLTLIFLGALFLIFWTSCSNEAVIEEQVDGIQLRINAGVNTRASVDPGSEDENKMEKLAIWFFPQNADGDDSPLLYHVKEVSASDVNISFTNQQLEAAKMSSEGIYDIYAIAYPDGEEFESLGKNVTSLTKLRERVYKTTEYDLDFGIDGRPFSPFIMSGQLLQCNFKKSNTATITLVRVAVKLHFTYTDNTGYALSAPLITIENDLKNVGIFTPISKETDMEHFTSDFIKSCEFIDRSAIAYINEYLGDTPVLMKIHATGDGKDYDWEVPILYNGEHKLYRNTSYELHLTLNPYSANAILTILPWEYSGEEEVQPVLPE